MAQTTRREYLAWTEWISRQWNEPDRTDHYLMQIAQEVAKTRCDPNTVGDKRINFVLKKREEPEVKNPLTRKEASDIGRAQWGAFLGRNLEQPKSEQ